MQKTFNILFEIVIYLKNKIIKKKYMKNKKNYKENFFSKNKRKIIGSGPFVVYSPEKDLRKEMRLYEEDAEGDNYDDGDEDYNFKNISVLSKQKIESRDIGKLQLLKEDDGDDRNDRDVPQGQETITNTTNTKNTTSQAIDDNSDLKSDKKLAMIENLTKEANIESLQSPINLNSSNYDNNNQIENFKQNPLIISSIQKKLKKSNFSKFDSLMNKIGL